MVGHWQLGLFDEPPAVCPSCGQVETVWITVTSTGEHRADRCHACKVRPPPVWKLGERCPLCGGGPVGLTGTLSEAEKCCPMCGGVPTSIAEMVFKGPHVRDAVFRRDGFVCWLCGGSTVDGAEPNSPMAPEIDHVIPTSRGGSDDVANVRCAHRFCNESRGDRQPDLSVAAIAERRRRLEDAVARRRPGSSPATD